MKCVKGSGSEETEGSEKYRVKAAAFNDCYDKSNPLTMKRGTIRLIDI